MLPHHHQIRPLRRASCRSMMVKPHSTKKELAESEERTKQEVADVKRELEAKIDNLTVMIQKLLDKEQS